MRCWVDTKGRNTPGHKTIKIKTLQKLEKKKYFWFLRVIYYLLFIYFIIYLILFVTGNGWSEIKINLKRTPPRSASKRHWVPPGRCGNCTDFPSATEGVYKRRGRGGGAQVCSGTDHCWADPTPPHGLRNKFLAFCWWHFCDFFYKKYYPSSKDRW